MCDAVTVNFSNWNFVAGKNKCLSYSARSFVCHMRGFGTEKWGSNFILSVEFILVKIRTISLVRFVIAYTKSLLQQQ